MINMITQCNDEHIRGHNYQNHENMMTQCNALLLPSGFSRNQCYRAHLVNVKPDLTESLYSKSYFSKIMKVISNLTNVFGTLLPGQTYVQKWFLDYGHSYGRFWPFLTLMAIFTQ